MQIWRCVRCGHGWLGRQLEKPRSCAKCKVIYWDRPARIPKPQKPPSPIGRPPLYPVQNLKVGESMILPWFPALPSGYPDVSKNRGMNIAIVAYAKRTNKKFFREGRGPGLLVTRVA